MANGVWHEGLQQVLALDQADLGLPEHLRHLAPDVIEALLRPIAERDRTLLQCVESQAGRVCKAELNGVQSRFMYLRKHRSPDQQVRLRAIHLPTTHTVTAEENDQREAMKEFVVRTCDTAGLHYSVGTSTRSRTAKPDVTVTSAGGVGLGCEAQYSNASPGLEIVFKGQIQSRIEAMVTAAW